VPRQSGQGASDASRSETVTPSTASVNPMVVEVSTSAPRRAVDLVRVADPTLIVDGEIMADTALSPEVLAETYPFSPLRKGGANVLIFPELQSANIAFKLLARLGGLETIGPILMGMSKPVHVLPRDCSVETIVNTAALAVVDAQEAETEHFDERELAISRARV